MKPNSKISLLLFWFLFLPVENSVAAVLFGENFDDGQAAGRWSIVSQQEKRLPSPYPPDGAVDLAFNYSLLGFTNPNGTADTTGGYIRVNLTDQVGNEGESYCVFPTDKNFAVSFFVEFDMAVFNSEVRPGVTEYGMAGVYLDNFNPVAPYQNGTGGGPIAWQYSGDGRTNEDLGAFRGGDASTTGYLSLGSYDTRPAGAIPGFDTGVANSRGPAAAGTQEMGGWVKVRIEVGEHSVSWFLNGVLIDAYNNSQGFPSDGNILIGAVDPFNSVSAASTGVIFDNVVVVGVPEPSPNLLSICAAAGVGVAIRTRSRRCATSIRSVIASR